MNISDLRNIIQEEVDLLREDNKDWTIGDLVKLGYGLAKLSEEDPTFQVKTDDDSGQTIISGIGNIYSCEILFDSKIVFKSFKTFSALISLL